VVSPDLGTSGMGSCARKYLSGWLAILMLLINLNFRFAQ
jgi:hypothetical protein